MNLEQEIEHIFDTLRKVLFYAGHGKYNAHMSLEDVQHIQRSVEKILEIEKEYNQTTLQKEKEAIYKTISVYKSYSIRDFVDSNIEQN